MKLSSTFVAALVSVAASAALATDAVNLMAAATPQWTIENMKRVCTTNSASCSLPFKIDTHTAAATACFFTVKGSPATQTNSGGIVCGPYTIGTGWSDQFGAGNGFTTLSVVNNSKKLVIYPSYTDKQLAGGKVVTPNQRHTPAKLS